jgi:hypothetical protein
MYIKSWGGWSDWVLSVLDGSGRAHLILNVKLWKMVEKSHHSSNSGQNSGQIVVLFHPVGSCIQ